jgi:hypothetical protein
MKNLMHPYLLALCILVAMSAAVHAQEVLSIKAVIAQTLSEGKATAWVEGGIAEKYISQLQNIAKRPPGPTSKMVLVQGERLQAFDTECGRINLKISRPGWTLPSKDGTQVPAIMGMDMNVCSDGSPAAQGMNIQRLAPSAAPLRPTRPPLELK